MGYLVGLFMALIFRQPGPDVRAISIETGIQNTGISIFLLRFSLEQPAADLTTGNNNYCFFKQKLLNDNLTNNNFN